jgi:hypothetical protein
MKNIKYTVLMAEAEIYDSMYQTVPGPNLYISRFLFNTKNEARRYVSEKIGQLSSNKDNTVEWIEWHSLYCVVRYSTTDRDGTPIERTVKMQIYDGTLESSSPVPLSDVKEHWEQQD